ncbi:hypothetical protein A3J41_01615 [candidate division TM6 bacterium RIFCSPHIGHO2_12_FULL_38_8]|nr:MAG: hypothetical protein A3J41_01615 [candidate division TM6 bacterium RIFCSPHIGHO2_12_FULL_38_8]
MITKLKILFITSMLLPNFMYAPDYEDHCLATTVQVMKHALKDRNPTPRKIFWLQERLTFLEEGNSRSDISPIHRRRQKYLAKRIKRLHPHQD